tara:strand:+ start:112 stop:294 length:183 start_codon:yes stop_codon:yes gene_type:complete
MMEIITILPNIDIKSKFNFVDFHNKNYNLNNINFVMKKIEFLKEKNIINIHYDDPMHSQR